MKVLRLLLFPFSLAFGFIAFVRNRLYDAGLFSSSRFEGIAVISVGNLSVGGTGKTPHIEYLIRLLRDSFTVATLSRGYGRASSGFRLAGRDSGSQAVGDEPAQLKRKFGDVLTVAVDADRVNGIKTLMASVPAPEVILLDDAFQHRAVKPGLSVLLSDYSRMFYRDHLLPYGRLREGAGGYRRADVIIVTKCPPDLPEEEQQAIRDKVKPARQQQLFFSHITYGSQLIPLGHGLPQRDLKEFLQNAPAVLLVTGIANPSPLEEYLKSYGINIRSLHFPDHHEYSEKDLALIQQTFSALPEGNRIIITTEKDAVRLDAPGIAAIRHLPVFCLPMEVRFREEEREKFDQLILHHVRTATGKH